VKCRDHKKPKLNCNACLLAVIFRVDELETAIESAIEEFEDLGCGLSSKGTICPHCTIADDLKKAMNKGK